MAIQLSTAVRNARLDAIETTAGTSAVLKIFTGAQPANCAAANAGTELVSMNLSSDWLAAAASGAKALAGTWSGTAIDTGTAGHFRIYASNGTTCHLQGDISDDMTLDNTSIASGQSVSVATFTLTDANS